MKTATSYLLCLGLLIFSFACKKEQGYAPGNEQQPGVIATPDPITSTLQGNVFDAMGLPAIGALVKVGSKSATTNDFGYFRIIDAELDENAALVTAEKAGFFKAYRSFQATSGVNQVTIQLIKKESWGTIDASTGGTVTKSNGASVTIPANAVVKAADNAAYTGTVTIYAAFIDPTAANIANIVPGSFMADDKDNYRVLLTSFGMLAVVMESAAGEKLQLLDGKKAELKFPIPNAARASAPATLLLWYLDESTGVWKEEGSAVKNGNIYTGEVSHFSFWNADIGLPVIQLKATLTTTAGEPLTYTQVRMSAPNGYNTPSYGITDSLGVVSGLVLAEQNLVLEVLNECNDVIHTQEIGPYTENASVDVEVQAIALVTITGKILNCQNEIVTDGYALINYSFINRFVAVNDAGEFTTSFPAACNGFQEIQILGFDLEGQQQSEPQAIAIAPGINDLGNILACGVTSEQFIEYTLDGVDYRIDDNNADSIFLFVNTPGDGGSTYLGGGADLILEDLTMWFNVSSTTGVGTFPVSEIWVNHVFPNTVSDAFFVTVTNFPALTGAFMEANFSGQYTDPNLQLHTINGRFKLIRRN